MGHAALLNLDPSWWLDSNPKSQYSHKVLRCRRIAQLTKLREMIIDLIEITTVLLSLDDWVTMSTYILMDILWTRQPGKCERA
jgi:hypothetical protein